jgi:uncharacterized protein (TIGR00645 family)
MRRLIAVLSKVIFFSRWFQAPLYLGLILALGLYVYDFSIDLINLILHISRLSETELMMGVLDLIDVVMIANLLIMVIVGGYDIFVCRIALKDRSDQPEWLDELNAGMMKVKLALALVSISSIHLLRTFFDINKMSREVVVLQVVIHLTLLLSVVTIAYTNKLIDGTHGVKIQK